MEVSKQNICALATAQGPGAIGIIRLSGPDTIDIVDGIFVPAGGSTAASSCGDPAEVGGAGLKVASLKETPAYKMRFGSIYKGDKLLDEVLVAVFRAPLSYTGENSVEIYCHGSSYILQEVLMLLISNGARMAEPGEFSKRAFLNGKLDLAQAEAVADVISSETASAHTVAMQQMKGGFSNELKEMRDGLLNLVSLMELELDFSEEDVEFADRGQLFILLDEINCKITSLIDSFSLGNAIKNGVPVAIVGATNTGKSTLLNALLGEEKAIVSNIHGTTRDVIEDTINLNGIVFRFIDTAGIRETKETIEMIGIERTYQKLRQASIVIMVLDATRPEFFADAINNLSSRLNKNKQKLIILLNKAETITDTDSNFAPFTSEDIKDICGKGCSFAAQIESISMLCKGADLSPLAHIPISAKQNKGIAPLKELLVSTQSNLSLGAGNATLVTNVRHFEALREAQISLDRVEDGLKSAIPTDLITQDIREAMFHLGSIVGEINTDEILGNIFGKFCIGK